MSPNKSLCTSIYSCMRKCSGGHNTIFYQFLTHTFLTFYKVRNLVVSNTQWDLTVAFGQVIAVMQVWPLVVPDVHVVMNPKESCVSLLLNSLVLPNKQNNRRQRNSQISWRRWRYLKATNSWWDQWLHAFSKTNIKASSINLSESIY